MTTCASPTSEVAETKKGQLLDRYLAAIRPEDLRSLPVVSGLSGLFVGSVCPAYFAQGRPRVMVIGREPRGWDGKRGFENAIAQSDDLSGYFARMMTAHEHELTHPPASSKFFQFYQQLQTKVARSTEVGSVAWGNLLCVSHNKGSPVTGLTKSQRATQEQIYAWSKALIRAQIEVLGPDVIFFVTSPSYDNLLKAFIDIDWSSKERPREVLKPKELWQFGVQGALAFRTRHPRVVASNEFRKDAIKRALQVLVNRPGI